MLYGRGVSYMTVRTLPAIAVSFLVLALVPASQARGGFRGIGPGGTRFGTLPPLTGGLPGTGIRPLGRGFSRGRFGFREGFWPWYGWGYADFDEPYLEEGRQPPVVVLREEPQARPAAHVVEPKLIEVPAAVEKTPRQPSLPTVLVWRNGQREEVQEYAISGAFLYDYSKPRASRRISLDDLDLEATERANQQRGVQFLIPASPSEVTVRF